MSGNDYHDLPQVELMKIMTCLENMAPVVKIEVPIKPKRLFWNIPSGFLKVKLILHMLLGK